MIGPPVYQQAFAQRLRSLGEDEELVWVSSEVPVPALRAAYSLGVFPWPGDDPDLFPWVAPLHRGILVPDQFHLGRSTRRALGRLAFRVTFDQAFSEVIQACAAAPDRETWIHPKMVDAYTEAHRQGLARSVEVWEAGELVGGLYGMDLGHVFSGESMFHRRPNAGKAAIAALVAVLASRPNGLLDIQQLTPHMEAMGAVEWPRERFQKFLHGLSG